MSELPQDFTEQKSQELIAALTAANKLGREGVPKKEIDAFLLNKYGMTKAALTQAVKAMPQEKPIQVTTGLLLKAQAYGLTGGWLDEIEGVIGALKGTGYRKARDNARKEMRAFEREYPALARSMQVLGGTAGVLAGGGAAQALKGGSLALMSPARAALAPFLGAAGRTVVGAGMGATAGAGGLLGETEGAGRAIKAVTGAGIGAVPGALSAFPEAAGLSPSIKKLLPWIGGAAAGGVGKKLLDFLTHKE
jgi:hypothetical protein